ncbi:MAG: porin family protein [Bacteroidia bacterium]|nr:porin family protein [Bacteroidia bacterium]
MKTKVFLTAIIFFFGANLLQAQPVDRRISFAINLQPHFNWIHADESQLSNGPVRLGIEGGLRLDYRIEKWYALSFGVNLNLTGGNIIYNDSLHLLVNNVWENLKPGTKVTYRLQYLEVPVALKFFLPEFGYSTWFAEIGLDPMFRTQAYINATDNNIQKAPYKDGVSKFNLAWHTGLGLNYSLGGNISLQFAIFYKNTFLDVTDENVRQKADNARINQIGLTVGLVF